MVICDRQKRHQSSCMASSSSCKVPPFFPDPPSSSHLLRLWTIVTFLRNILINLSCIYITNPNQKPYNNNGNINHQPKQKEHCPAPYLIGRWIIRSDSSKSGPFDDNDVVEEEEASSTKSDEDDDSAELIEFSMEDSTDLESQISSSCSSSKTQHSFLTWWAWFSSLFRFPETLFSSARRPISCYLNVEDFAEHTIQFPNRFLFKGAHIYMCGWVDIY